SSRHLHHVGSGTRVCVRRTSGFVQVGLGEKSCHGVLFALPISSKPVFWPTSEWPTIRELSRRLHGHSVTKQAFLTTPTAAHHRPPDDAVVPHIENSAQGRIYFWVSTCINCEMISGLESRDESLALSAV